MGVPKRPYPLCGEDMLKRHKPSGPRVAVIGSKVYEKSNDRRRHYPECIGIDMLDGEGVDVVHDLQKPLFIEPFDHIDCCSVLEHAQKPWLVAENLTAVLREGGSLLVTTPFVWRVHGYPDDYWRFTASSLPVLFPDIRWVDVSYYSMDGRVKSVPAYREGDRVWFEKTELAAWGVK